MSLDPNTWTLKTQDAINVALAGATSASNPEVVPEHLDKTRESCSQSFARWA